MNVKDKIHSLYHKLKNKSISRAEYEEFLSYSQDEGLRDVLDEILDQEMEVQFSNNKLLGVSGSRKSSLKSSHIWSAVAASCLIMILAAIWIWQPSKSSDIQYVTSNGETMEIVLPDSSVVMLNANSSLVWRTSNQNELREVRLSGEAFFNVRSMTEKPFRVYSNEMIIEVLGTSFNLNNRENKDEVFLEEGSIRINNQKNMEDTIHLETGEAAFFHVDSLKVVKTTDSRFEDQAKWKDGILKFRNRKVQEILEEMQHIYGVQLKIDDAELLENPMDFALPYSNWSVVSKALALALGTELIEYEDHYEFVRN